MNSGSDHTVDVLIPVFNGASTVASSLRSIQNQTVTGIRIVVVDDGSTDATPDLVQAISAEDPRIEYVRSPRNSGIVDALNLGLSHCSAPFIARHDADDLSSPNRFAVQLDYLRANPDCIAVSGTARHIDADGNPIGSHARPLSPETADPRWIPAREPHLMHPFLMVRRDDMAAVGGYRHALHTEDADLYWRLQERGRLHNLPDVLGDYRFHAGGITSRSIHNGMVGAVTSQLAAIAATRRRAGEPDLAFSHERLPAYGLATTLAGLIECGSTDLTLPERDHLRLAAAAKLVEQACYRLYRLRLTDAWYVNRTLTSGWPRLNPDNAAELEDCLTGLAIKMLYHRRFLEGTALLPYHIFGRAVWAVARTVLLKRLRRLGIRAREPAGQ